MTTGERYESEATQLRRLPILWGARSGILQLDDDRLRFTARSRNRTVFDLPLRDMHSAQRGATSSLYLWHGRTRYRFVAGNPIYVPGPGELAVEQAIGLPAARIPGALARERANRDTADRWIELLQPGLGAPPPGLRVPRPWPRWAWLLTTLGAGLLVCAIIAAVTLAFAEPDRRIEATVELPNDSNPGSVVFDGTGLWVALGGPGFTVVRIDPASARVTTTLSLPNAPAGLVHDGTSVWVAHSLPRDGLSRIDPVTATVAATFELPEGSNPDALAFDGTSLWTTRRSAPGPVLRIDRTDGSVTARVTLPNAAGGPAPEPNAVVFDGASIWVADRRTETVAKINPVTATLTTTVAFGADALAFDGTSLWAASTYNRTVARIDPATATVTASIGFPAAGGPKRLVADRTGVWVTRSDDKVSRIDPATATITTTVSLGSNSTPIGLASDGNHLWVAAYGASRVMRLSAAD